MYVFVCTSTHIPKFAQHPDKIVVLHSLKFSINELSGPESKRNVHDLFLIFSNRIRTLFFVVINDLK